MTFIEAKISRSHQDQGSAERRPNDYTYDSSFEKPASLGISKKGRFNNARSFPGYFPGPVHIRKSQEALCNPPKEQID